MPEVYCKRCRKKIEVSAKDAERSSILCHDCMFPNHINKNDKTNNEQNNPDINNCILKNFSNFKTKR